MNHLSQITTDHLRQSVIAVPPLARNIDLSINESENQKIINHLEHGGITFLLYGGNANYYHIALNEYESLLNLLDHATAPQTIVVPAVGPSFALAIEQAAILRNTVFSTAMYLPPTAAFTPDGFVDGFRRFVKAYAKPAVLYIKHDNMIHVPQVKALVREGLVSWIKYAIVREDPAEDPYLSHLTNEVDPNLIVSGIGEQPAIIHTRDFNLAGFTAGCVCVAPTLSMNMLLAIKDRDYETAESIREQFEPLEDLRNAIHPVRVLHDAITLAQIADAGPILPLLSNLKPDESTPVKRAAIELLQIENNLRSPATSQ